MGGLGNQLSQVAASWYLQRRRGLSVRCDASWYSSVRTEGDAARSLEVLPILPESEYVSIPRWRAQLIYSRRNPRCFIEKAMDDDVLSRLSVQSAWVQGYFQNAKYPLSTRDRLVDRILPLLDGIVPSSGIEQAIGVHIRLGDYYTNPVTRAHHGITAPAYFAGVIEEIFGDGSNPNVAVFTDSPAIVKEQYLRHLSAEVQVISSRTAWETLRDLSSCAGIVMSNSSLSWWAAVVASVLRGRDVRIVKPVPWFARVTAADQLLMVPGWIERSRQTQISTQPI
jgi:hypothetical protein